MQQYLQKAQELLQQVQLPSLPEEVLLLKEELNKKYPNSVTIANLISHHPELLADFLNLVNTNITTEKQEVTEARAAVNVLGLDDLYNIFLSTVLTNTISETPLEKEILQQGAKAGLAAAELSYWVQDVSRSEAYMAGLLQNVGAIYLSRLNPSLYQHLFQQQLATPITGFQEELKQFGTGHPHMGVIIAKKWHIHDAIYKSILLHHCPDFAEKSGTHTKIKHLIALVILTNYIVSMTTGEQYLTKEAKNFRDQALQELNLPKEQAFKAAVSVVEKFGHKVGVILSSH